jgi:hypothetical protein
MEGQRGPGNRDVRPEGGESLLRPPAPRGMPVPSGVGHRKAPERLPSAAGTPRELRVSSRSAGSRAGETPWGAGPSRRGSPRRRGRKRVRGPAAAKAAATARGSWAPKGGSGVLEPWPWNQGVRAQVPRRRRSFRPRIPQSSGTERTGAEGAQRVWRHTTAFPPERALRVETPGAAAGVASSQGRRGSKPSRG